MGSFGAMQAGSRDRYFQENEKKLVPEGIEGRVPYKGPSGRHRLPIGRRIEGGHGLLRSEKPAGAEGEDPFIRVTDASLRESHPHDIQITKEAPNYHV